MSGGKTTLDSHVIPQEKDYGVLDLKIFHFFEITGSGVKTARYTHALLQGFSFGQIRQNITSNLLHLWVKSLLHLWVIRNYYICG